MLPSWLLVFVGGGLGSVCRYGLGRWLMAMAGTQWPLGTLGVNGLGCLLIGFWLTIAQRWAGSSPWTLLLATGFCGGFTTFSTFAYENRQFLARQSPSLALAYSLGSLAIGLGGVYLGEWLARRL